MEQRPFAEELAAFPIVVRWPVQWGDQDAFQHVNNTIYFRWFESVRIVYLERIGLETMLMEREHVGPILAAISCSFRSPVTYPDTVQLAARITRMGRSSVGMEHRVYSEQQRKIVTEGDSTIVVFVYAAQRPRPIPDDIRRAIEAIEGRELPAT